MLDYNLIGRNIRKYRKLYNYSQEQLAERIQISTIHMSHIETGNTKLSLPVCVKIAEVLHVRIDELIYDSAPSTKPLIKEELAELIDSCTENEAQTLIELMKSYKVSLDKYLVR